MYIFRWFDGKYGLGICWNDIVDFGEIFKHSIEGSNLKFLYKHLWFPPITAIVFFGLSSLTRGTSIRSFDEFSISVDVFLPIYRMYSVYIHQIHYLMISVPFKTPRTSFPFDMSVKYDILVVNPTHASQFFLFVVNMFFNAVKRHYIPFNELLCIFVEFFLPVVWYATGITPFNRRATHGSSSIV